MVISGVVFEDESSLSTIPVRDSKQLSPKRRTDLAQIIIKQASSYEFLVIPASDIDDMRKVMTLNEIEVNAFAKVIKKLKPDICYVDAADVNEKRFATDILSLLSKRPKLISKHKADDIYPIVSAASILAKTKRDELVSQIGKELEKKLNMPLGSGYPADPITIEFLKTWITTYGKLPPHTRKSWKTAQKLLNQSKLKSLDEF